MTVVLHIGMPKTGSSALQFWLAEHHSQLAERGLHYALGHVRTKAGQRISSGNGVLLSRYLNPRKRNSEFSEVEFERAFDSLYLSPRCETALISSEMLAGATPAQLQRFKAEVLGGREVRIVAFVRDLYDFALSNWMQLVKRRAYQLSFASFCGPLYVDHQFRIVRTFGEAFGLGQVSLIHYRRGEDVSGRLLAALGVEPILGADPPPLINRSLSPFELDVLLACNRIHRSPALSRWMSDHLVNQHPARGSATIWAPEAASRLHARHAGDLAWLNQQFFGGESVLSVGGPPGEQAMSDLRAAAPRRAILRQRS